jgi:hypothetical protein
MRLQFSRELLLINTYSLNEIRRLSPQPESPALIVFLMKCFGFLHYFDKISGQIRKSS